MQRRSSLHPSSARPFGRARGARALYLLVSLVSLWVAVGCGSSAGNSPPPPPPCDQTCADETALRAVREALKLVFNVTLQGKPVGAHDETVPCPLGGTARVYGQATSNAVQGSTDVTLTYVLDHCAYSQKTAEPAQSYAMTVSGTINEAGTLAVQPSSTTALLLKSDSVTLDGTVYDPPIDYHQSACALVVGQNGNQLSGTLCGRQTGLTL